MADKSISLDILDEDYDVVVNDFCSWEILDSYHDSDSDDFSFPDASDDLTTEIQVISQYLDSPGSPGSLSSSDDDASLVSQSPHQRYLVIDEDEVIPPVVVTGEDLGLNAFVSFPLPVDDVTPESDHHQKNVGFGAVMYDDYEGKYGYDEEEEDDNNEDYGPANNDLYLYDDELVPIGVSNKLEKQRIRKSGKKGGCGKKKNSKKMPHHSNRPGCVYGKYGLGVQHLMI